MSSRINEFAAKLGEARTHAEVDAVMTEAVAAGVLDHGLRDAADARKGQISNVLARAQFSAQRILRETKDLIGILQAAQRKGERV